MSMSSQQALKLAQEARDPRLREALTQAAQGDCGANLSDLGASRHKSHENRTQTQIPDPEPEQQPAALALKSSGEAPSAGRPHVCFTLRRVRLLDVDAKWGSVKDSLDGLQYAGLIPGDREDQITLEVRQEKVNSFKEEETLITVTLWEPTTT